MFALFFDRFDKNQQVNFPKCVCIGQEMIDTSRNAHFRVT